MERTGGALAGAVLVLMPKCPACVAAYAAAWTGLGLSFAAAATLRNGLLLAAAGALCYAALSQARRLSRKHRPALQRIP